MPPNQSAKLANDERRCRVARLYLRGQTQREIAVVEKVNQSTIARDLEVIQKLWLASTLLDFNERKAIEIAKLDAAERELWLAWDRSIRPARSRKSKTTILPPPLDPNAPKPLPTDVEVTIDTERRDGDPRFMTAILDVIEKRCKLLGLYEPPEVPTEMLRAAAMMVQAALRNPDGLHALDTLARAGDGGDQLPGDAGPDRHGGEVPPPAPSGEAKPTLP